MISFAEFMQGQETCPFPHKSLSSGKPVMFCVLTDDNEAQTEARSGGVHGNKGVEAAAGLLHMLALKRTLTSS